MAQQQPTSFEQLGPPDGDTLWTPYVPSGAQRVASVRMRIWAQHGVAVATELSADERRAAGGVDGLSVTNGAVNLWGVFCLRFGTGWVHIEHYPMSLGDGRKRPSLDRVIVSTPDRVRWWPMRQPLRFALLEQLEGHDVAVADQREDEHDLIAAAFPQFAAKEDDRG